MRREPLAWRAREVELRIDRTLVMGILNATPDSFSDGGRFLDGGAAVARALQITDEGADILDIGGESTRPGALPVTAEEEWRRVRPVLDRIRGTSDIPISIDTYKPEIARKAIRAGAVIVNDIHGLRDPEMVRVVGNSRAGVVVLHMKGEPETMNVNPQYADVVSHVKEFLTARLDSVVAHGVDREAVVLDPGLGFGKSPAHNTDLLRRLLEIHDIGRPVLVGTSRKSFLVKPEPSADPRLGTSLAAAGLAVLNGADILRVHDVAETIRFLRSPDALTGRENL